MDSTTPVTFLVTLCRVTKGKSIIIHMKRTALPSLARCLFRSQFKTLRACMTHCMSSQSQSVSTPHSTPSLTKFPFWSILHLPFFSIHRGEQGEERQHGMVPAFKQDGEAFQFLPSHTTPAGCGSGDLVGRMDLWSDFIPHRADTVM